MPYYSHTNYKLIIHPLSMFLHRYVHIYIHTYICMYISIFYFGGPELSIFAVFVKMWNHRICKHGCLQKNKKPIGERQDNQEWSTINSVVQTPGVRGHLLAWEMNQKTSLFLLH